VNQSFGRFCRFNKSIYQKYLKIKELNLQATATAMPVVHSSDCLFIDGAGAAVSWF
jgi:hypothetical protein